MISKCKSPQKISLLSLNKELKEFDTVASKKNEATFTFVDTITLEPQHVAQRINELSTPEEKTISLPQHFDDDGVKRHYPKRRDACMNLFDLYEPGK